MSATVLDKPIAASGTKTVLVVQCAWCGRLKRGGVYSGPSMALVHEMSGHGVSHGICPACAAKVEAVEAAARRSAAVYRFAA